VTRIVNKDLEALRKAAYMWIQTARSSKELEEARLALLGRKGDLTQLLKGVKDLPVEQRQDFGKSANELKLALSEAINARYRVLLDETSVIEEGFDLTRPGFEPRSGGLHPTMQMCYDLNDAFQSLNFNIFDGPEITSELFAFDYLNFPPDHPARDSMDTYWLDEYEAEKGAERLCLRPHLTGGSVRYMQSHTPPFRLVYPGRVYRNEATDASHERAFFQYEALIVDKSLPFTAGRLLVNTILDTVFGRRVKTRMRAGFFPFVEPGFEIDMECLVCDGTGCRVCKYVGWLEIMPGGAPHPNVLRAGGVDPSAWEGFYLNIGLDRLVMMRYGVDDVRLFHGTDLRFLTQFR